MINNIVKSNLQIYLSEIFIDLSNISNTVFLAGTGRSGTTWLAEIINYDNSFRFMFEPFHSLKIDIIKQWNYRQYLRIENTDEMFIRPAAEILSGSIRDPWIDRFNKKHIVKKRLIKDIRANLLLKWIKCNFPEIPIILLLRHPCAVANSKLKLGWGDHLADFMAQEDLVEDFLGPFKEKIEDAKDMFAKYIFMWCIENYIPLKQFVEGEILLTFYENLCINPQSEIERIFSFIGREFSPEVNGIVGKASALTRRDSAINFGGNLTTSWRKEINNEQIKQAVEILSMFGMHKIYNDKDFPLLSPEDALKEF